MPRPTLRLLPPFALLAAALLAGPGSAGDAPPAAPAPAPSAPPHTGGGAPTDPAGPAELQGRGPEPTKAIDAGGVTVPLGAPELRLISIDEAVQTALRRNPTLEQVAAAIRKAQGAVQEARALERPRIDLSNQYTFTGPIPSFNIQGQTIPFGRTFSKTLAVQGSVPLDPFGRLRSGRRIAEAGTKVARGAFYVEQNELVFQVQNVYLAGLRSQELIRVAREAVDLALEQLRVAEVQFRAGTSPEFDVIRARVQVANNRQNLVTAEASFRRTIHSLAQVLSLDPETRVQLLPLLLPPEPDAVAAATAQQVIGPEAAAGPLRPASPVLPDSVERALSEAFERRQELYRADWNRRMAKARLTQQHKGLLPDVSLAVNFLYAPDQSGLAVETKTWTILANITAPIWDAGLTRARVKQARADVDAAEAEAKAARDAVVQEVKTALTDLQEATERRRAAAANTTQAREALRIAQVRYTAGLAPNVEVTDAQVALTQAETNEVNAAYDYLGALANLNRSLGRYAGESLTMLGNEARIRPAGTVPAFR